MFDRNRTHFLLQEAIEDYSELIADILVSGASAEIVRTGTGIKVFRVFREKEFCTLDLDVNGVPDRYRREEPGQKQADQEPEQKRIKECQIVKPI